MGELSDRQLARIGTPDANGCIPWLGATKNGGYGYVRRQWGGKVHDVRMHRLVWETFVGPLGDQVLHHTCGNKGCVNPDHLEAVSPRAHVAAHRAPLCPKGHNRWRWQRDGKGYPHRYCLTCKLEGEQRRKDAASGPVFLGTPTLTPSSVTVFTPFG